MIRVFVLIINFIISITIRILIALIIRIILFHCFGPALSAEPCAEFLHSAPQPLGWPQLVFVPAPHEKECLLGLCLGRRLRDALGKQEASESGIETSGALHGWLSKIMVPFWVP